VKSGCLPVDRATPSLTAAEPFELLAGSRDGHARNTALL
jgi:hypothetical protein